jgi:hypothetical protein
LINSSLPDHKDEGGRQQRSNEEMMGVTTRMKFFLLTLIIGLSAVSNLAFAHETSDTDSQIMLSMNGGVTGLIAEGSWIGQYVYAGPSAYIPLRENLALIPSLTFEVAPGAGNWGFVATGTLELLLPKGPFAIDLVPSISQDTSSDGTMVLAWSVGPGTTFSFLNGITLSGTIQASGIFGHSEAGIILQPTLSFRIPIR